VTEITHFQIKTGTDKLGDTYTAWYTSSIKDVPTLYTTVLRQYADLLDAGHAPIGSTVPFTNNPTIYIKYGDTIAASITFRFDSDLAWIVFTNVHNQYQGRGLYAQLHQFFEVSARRNKCTRAGSMLHVDNTRIRDIAKANGYVPEFVRMVKQLK